MIPDLVDSHCHLDFPQFDGQIPEVIARAAAAGVTRMVTICTRLRSEPDIRAIAEAHPAVFYAAGTHPMNVAKEPMATVDQLIAIAAHPKCIGIGETGLDYHYTSETAALQQASLRVHIEACRQTGLPLIIHSRDADDDMVRILTEEFKAGSYTCVMHCFSSGHGLAMAALELGFYLSMSGIAAFPRSDELRGIFSNTPLDRILVETDSPYLSPPPHRGKTCEPAYSALTAAKGAETMGVSYAEFCAATSANFERLFTKAARGVEAA
ncbi:MAG: TatD family hydrolase [Pseudomonadota bacterium]